jgi:hypothetical protein
MTASVTAIWIICAVIVASLAIWLISVALAARKPYHEHPRGERLRGRVQGGMHVGGGRSVSPNPEEPVTPGDAPEGDTVSPEVADQRRSGSPMDL